VTNVSTTREEKRKRGKTPANRGGSPEEGSRVNSKIKKREKKGRKEGGGIGSSRISFSLDPFKQVGLKGGGERLRGKTISMPGGKQREKKKDSNPRHGGGEKPRSRVRYSSSPSWMGGGKEGKSSLRIGFFFHGGRVKRKKKEKEMGEFRTIVRNTEEKKKSQIIPIYWHIRYEVFKRLCKKKKKNKKKNHPHQKKKRLTNGLGQTNGSRKGEKRGGR